MVSSSTINEIISNTNTGIEYEIALFTALLPDQNEKDRVLHAIRRREDYNKVLKIYRATNVQIIQNKLREQNLFITDCSFETQNDEVGPADLVLILNNGQNLGLSVKYANTCTLNVTGRKFISLSQIAALKERYKNFYIPRYRTYMRNTYGNAANWHRKTSPVTDEIIDEIRDAVITNWQNITDKVALLNNMFHADSPMDFWVVTYTRNGIELETIPPTVEESRANDVTVDKYQTSYVGFYLDGRMIGKMQVKFNNGFIESNFKHNGQRKRVAPDFIEDGLEFIYGAPFGSWNFSVIM